MIFESEMDAMITDGRQSCDIQRAYVVPHQKEEGYWQTTIRRFNLDKLRHVSENNAI
jgi:hypothetical protein